MGLDSSVLVDLVVVGSVAVSEKGKLETGCPGVLKAALSTLPCQSFCPAGLTPATHWPLV